jgi:AraC-like DNA-binding protein
MDALVGLLDGPRARGAYLLRAILSPPWCVRIQDEAPLSLVAMVRGEAVVIPDDGPPSRMRPGDVAIMRGPDHYTVADEQDRPIQAVIHPGQRSTTVQGADLCAALDLGVRTWGTGLDGPTMMLIGTYQLRGAISQRLLVALPGVLVLPAESLDSALISLLAAEITKDDPGQEAVLDRLLDLLLIAVLRSWFARADAGAPAWYRAHRDRLIGHALRLLHNQPDRPWTVASLSTTVGLSRAAFARRFTELVGEPPMSYLTGWRLTLAADLLREPDATLAAVARQVGYSTPFALSTAFKRVHGISPQTHKHDHRNA